MPAVKRSGHVRLKAALLRDVLTAELAMRIEDRLARKPDLSTCPICPSRHLTAGRVELAA